MMGSALGELARKSAYFMEERSEQRYSSNCDNTEGEERQPRLVSSEGWEAWEANAHLRPEEVVAPSEDHPDRSRRILRVPGLLDRAHDVVHPATVGRRQRD